MPPGRTIDFATRRRSVTIVAVSVVVVAVLVLLAIKIYDANQDDPAPDRGAARIVMPAAFGSFAKATDSAAAVLTDQLRSTARSGKDDYRKKFAVYRNGAGQRILVTAFSAHDSADARDFLAGGSTSDVLDEVLVDSKVIGSKDYPPTPFGGAFRCGTGVYGTNAATAVCGWADKDTAATVVDVSAAATDKPVGPAALAEATRQLRGAAEAS